jgi:acyl carrier protein
MLERLLAAREPQVLVVPIGARQWRDLSARASGSPLLTRLVEECFAKTDQTLTKRELLAIESAAARRIFLESKLRLEVANVLRVEAAAVDPQQPLRELGIDSLMAIELRNALEAMFGVRLPSTVVWNCPTVAALGQELLRKMDLPLVDPTASQAEPPANGVEALQDDDLLASLLAVADDLSPEALRSAVEENETLA